MVDSEIFLFIEVYQIDIVVFFLSDKIIYMCNCSVFQIYFFLNIGREKQNKVDLDILRKFFVLYLFCFFVCYCLLFFFVVRYGVLVYYYGCGFGQSFGRIDIKMFESSFVDWKSFNGLVFDKYVGEGRV